MAERIIIRGDSYGMRRPLYRIELMNALGGPFDLAGCTLKTTYKKTTTSHVEDPSDVNAPIRHELKVDVAGMVVVENGLHLEGNAEDGVIVERLTKLETRNLPLGEILLGDFELTDANGEVFTWIFTDGIKAIDAYTNRE